MKEVRGVDRLLRGVLLNNNKKLINYSANFGQKWFFVLNFAQ
jgi:hypothetical protein